MDTKLQLGTATEESTGYELLLALSSDSLMIVKRGDPGLDLVSTLRRGLDDDGFIGECADEDHFLECILIILDEIDAGRDATLLLVK